MDAPKFRLLMTLMLGGLLAIGLAGCGGDDAGTADMSGSHAQNGNNDNYNAESAQDAANFQPDAGAQDASQPGADASGATDASEYDPVDAVEMSEVPAPGDETLGVPCSSDSDCPSGHCESVGGEHGGVCSVSCEDASGCPSGWGCETVYSADGKFCTCESSDEVCDGRDNDCDGLVDEGGSEDLCGGDGLCVEAACMCPVEFSCGDSCRDLFSDPDHCGTCGNACDVACSAGSCTAAVQVSVGADHVCMVLADGRLRCAGDNSYGQLGDGTTTSTDRPTDVLWMDETTQAAAANQFSCALDRRGDVYCWGHNGQGQVAPPPHTERHRPTRWDQISQAVALDTNHYTGCAVTESGEVHCWGPHGFPEPTLVEGLRDATHIGVGDYHRCAVVTGGQVACWGDNSSGQLGDGGTLNRDEVQLIPMLSDAVQVTAGQGHTCVLQTSGSVKCFGSNSDGQLGDDLLAQLQSLTPTKVRNLDEATAITAGSRHSCAVTEDDGEVYCWGANDQGQLGDGSTSESTRPVRARGLPAARSVDADDQTTCALTQAGEVYCWGEGFGVNPRRIRW